MRNATIDKPINFNWRMFFLAIGIALWLGLSIGPTLVCAGFVEIVASIVADAIKAAARKVMPL